MPDITMCCNYECPFREKCYRYRAVPDEYWQSFAWYKPKTSNIVGGAVTQCDYYWELDVLADKFLPMDVIDNRYERDSKWKGIKNEEAKDNTVDS